MPDAIRNAVALYTQVMVGVEVWLRPMWFGLSRNRNDSYDEYAAHFGPLTLRLRYNFRELDL